MVTAIRCDTCACDMRFPNNRKDVIRVMVELFMIVHDKSGCVVRLVRR